jgi:hypothetical protein
MRKNRTAPSAVIPAASCSRDNKRAGSRGRVNPNWLRMITIAGRTNHQKTTM